MDRITCVRPQDGGFICRGQRANVQRPNIHPYIFRSSKLLSFMTSSLCPREIISNLLLGIKWLLRDAVEISGKNFVGADLMFLSLFGCSYTCQRAYNAFDSALSSKF